ncbi:hypothetical protein SporoP37_05605 [Sporosarcina sp. P37]|uniref:DUF2935 domain-containing protein n=1 Tax=unclassified Sporosarcina TaxID=2647733 RepID=UPI000A17A49D|nr:MULTISPECIES: DUF2935 domain-containing protein [unclassified Sporosarcina]ARK24212.1 hypothetical protein SporoP37_05605 [Sporosarcina sp. P37]PID15766.1 DUF2935 domain-containing protein [Sporosarcina sp. P35]
MKSFSEEASFELRFWLQILGDHGRFMHDSLAPEEVENIKTASYYIELFDYHLATARQSLDEQSLIKLTKEAKKASEEIRKFKLLLIEQHLVGKIKISLSPTFINHMVNEVEEAIRIFTCLEKGEKLPTVHSLHHDLLWLLDAAGHADAIDENLDNVEKQLKKKSEKFAKEWEAFYLSAIEMAGFLRTNVMKFPALDKFHSNINLEMTIFKTFLKELEEMRINKETLGTLSPLMADHMAREETYYLMKLAETTDLPSPKGDPTKPRTKS